MPHMWFDHSVTDPETPAIQSPNRRRFIGGAAALVSSLALSPQMAFAGTDRRLHMYNPHTSETFNAVVIENGRWVKESLKEFNRFARDWRQNEIRTINPDSISIAVRIQGAMDSNKPMHLLSGYRSPQTNRELRGTARKSLHMSGLALDLSQPDRSVNQLHRAARACKSGGVGKYSRSGFVHIDCGRIRYWGA
jgi:uncharacterized protein YcbK (DUF882 family)